MRIQLSDHFTYGRLLRFTLPSVVMMVFISIYSIADGAFVSNCVGSNALSSVNIMMPMCMVVSAFGFMIGTGGSAVVSKTLGEGKLDLARRYFTMLILAVIALSAVLSLIAIFFMRPIAYLLGASDLLIEDCVSYGTIQMYGNVLFMLQAVFQSFFIVAEKPKLGLWLTVASGVADIALDYLFIYVWDWGIAGAAWSNNVGFAIGSIVPILYFASKNDSLLRFTRTKLYPRALLKSCTNGAAEMISNLSASVVMFLLNLQMMRLIGEDGVAAITVILYVDFAFASAVFGFCMGGAPIIGFDYGADNRPELRNIFKKSLVLLSAAGVALAAGAELSADTVAGLFISANPALREMTAYGFRVYAPAYLIFGVNIFGSSFFTALGNGKLSALISFLRTMVFQAGMILLLPRIFGLDGIWFAIVAAEVLTACVTVPLLIRQRKVYLY
ncbi:MAG TPA: MATE family efflux transporter [Oscillospiraceae bacterium]|nr:MATE family efflux transporter [Oscillospiraceae bacterium]HNW04666.1 MATE family efflux transporter [Oscillospiraceae bacterium]